MKLEEIEVGKIYTNGSTARKVVAAGPEYVLYKKQEDRDCVRYQVVQGRGRGGEHNCTRRSFASWAKAEVRT